MEGASGLQSPWGTSPRAVLEGIGIEGLCLVNVFVRSFTSLPGKKVIFDMCISLSYFFMHVLLRDTVRLSSLLGRKNWPSPYRWIGLSGCLSQNKIFFFKFLFNI